MLPLNILRNVSLDMLMARPATPYEKLISSLDSTRSAMELTSMYFQAKVCKTLERIEGGKQFTVNKFNREDGGGEVACVLQGGKIVEKAGIHVAAFNGHLPPMAVQQMKTKFKDLHPDGLKFFATAVSGVTHFVNPHVPTMHFNYRYFEVEDINKKKCSWFGGGQDLTPVYIYEEDAAHFHTVLKDACDKHNPEYYPKYKKWCDEYFWNTFRGEARGIGGIFFDDLEEPDLESCFQFVFSCGEAILPAYMPIVEKHLNDEYTEKEKYWQQIRRGRYVEFNLVIDRGTKFGLFTPGIRVESILMSLPFQARWEYMHEPEEGSKEQQLIQVLKKPRDWA